MKNDQEGGIKTDHFLTLDFYYNRGRRAYHFQKMDQLQRVRQSIFISMLYTTHYTFFVWYKFYSLPPFFYPPTSLRSLQIFFVGHFFLPLQFLRGELIGWECAHTKGPNHFTSCEEISLSPHLVVALMEHFLEGIAPLRHCDINLN